MVNWSEDSAVVSHHNRLLLVDVFHIKPSGITEFLLRKNSIESSPRVVIITDFGQIGPIVGQYVRVKVDLQIHVERDQKGLKSRPIGDCLSV